MLRARSLAFTSGNETEYKAAKYGLRKAITVAKRQYKEKLDSFYSTADAGQMWQGLQHITDYKTTTNTNISPSDSLPDDFNTFYARFETSSVNTERRHTHTWGSLTCHLRSSATYTAVLLEAFWPAASLCGTAALKWGTANVCREWWRLPKRSLGLHCPLCRQFTNAEFSGVLPSSLRTPPTHKMVCSHSYPQDGGTGVWKLPD